MDTKKGITVAGTNPFENQTGPYGFIMGFIIDRSRLKTG